MTIKHPRILVVDDDKVIRTYIDATLSEELPCELFFAADGQQALEHCNEIPPDLVLLDLVLPKINGFDVAKKLRSKNIAFIAMTGLEGTETIEELTKLGTTSFLSKPISKDQLVGTIMSALSQLNHITALTNYAEANGEICTAKGAISAYLSIPPDRAFDVIKEIGRDHQGSAKDSALVVNQFLQFIGKANDKYSQQQSRTKKRGRTRR